MRTFAKHFFINFVSLFLFYLSEFAIIAVLPLFITGYLHFDKSYSGIFMGIFSAAAMITKFLSGAMADKIGRLVLYKGALFFCGVTIFFYSKVGGLAAVFVVTFLHGLSSGVVRSLFMSVIASIIPKKILGTTVGIIGIAIMASMMLSAVFSVTFIEYYSYEKLFALLTILYIVAAALIFLLKIKDEKQQFTIKIGSFIEKEVIPLALLRFMGAISYGLFLSYGIIHAKEIGGFNPGIVITIYAAVNIVTRPLYGFMLDKFCSPIPRLAIIAPYIFLFIGYLAFSRGDAALVLIGALVIGVGSGMEYTAIGSTALKKVDKAAFNRASSTMELFLSLGIALSAMLSGLLFSGSLSAIFTFASCICILPIVFASIYYMKRA